METTDTQQASTPDADICGELRTNCGQKIHHSIEFRSRDEAIKALCKAVFFGAEPVYPDPVPTPPAERPTPITDAVWRKHTGFSPQSAADAYELAGTLERQLAEAREQRDRLAEAGHSVLENDGCNGSAYDAQELRTARRRLSAEIAAIAAVKGGHTEKPTLGEPRIGGIPT